MTSLEHVSVKHAFNHMSSWTGDEDGDVPGVRGDIEVEEVSVGVAVTTAEDEEEVGIVGHEQGRQRIKNIDGIRNAHDSGSKDDGNEDRRRDPGGAGSCESVAFRRSDGTSSPLGSASRSRSGPVSRSNSNSNSHSRSQSQSQSQLSVRGGLEMGESSVATSWTPPADAEGVGRRPSAESHCRSSTDRPRFDVTPRDGTGVVSLSRLRTNATTGTDTKGGGDMSRKEEVLVLEEEDIGEGWHPLRYNGKARSQDDNEDEVEEEKGEGSVHALASIPGSDQPLEMNEKERWRTFGSSSSSGRNAKHLRLEFQRPSPQPWDDIDPPTDNNEVYASDYYSTLNSKKFETLQKSRRRPLIPHSSYYFGPPPPDSAYGTSPVGQIGVHHPREIVRIERDYVGGELIQFSPVFPLELEGRITPTQFHQTINEINEMLISAHSIRRGIVDNVLAVVTLQLSTLVLTSHYVKEMRRLKRKIEVLNTQMYNPVGLHIVWPQKVAFLFLEIEYY